MRVRGYSMLFSTAMLFSIQAYAGQMDSKMLRDAEADAARAMSEMSYAMDARQISQAIAMAETCSLEMNLEKVSEIAGLFAKSDNPTARSMFQTGGRAQQLRYERMTKPEQAAACGEARAISEKHGLLQ